MRFQIQETVGVICNGKRHKISILESGALHLHDHTKTDVKATRVAMALGLPVPRCLEVRKKWTHITAEGMPFLALAELNKARNRNLGRVGKHRQGWSKQYGAYHAPIVETWGKPIQRGQRIMFCERRTAMRLIIRTLETTMFLLVKPTPQRRKPSARRDKFDVLNIRLGHDWWRTVYLKGIAVSGGVFVVAHEHMNKIGTEHVVQALWVDPEDAGNVKLRFAYVDATKKLVWLRGVRAVQNRILDWRREDVSRTLRGEEA